jgi:2-dehydropantoate 2-reductase
VTLCARRRFDEVRVTGPDGTEATYPLPATTDPGSVGPVEVVFVATKAQASASTAPWLDHLVGPATTVVVVQNGLNHAERFAGLVAAAQLVPSLAWFGGEQIGPGHVTYRGGNRLVVPSGARSNALVAALGGSGLDVRVDEDFVTAAWRKLLGNLVANPITTLTLRRADVFHDPDIRELASGVLDEAVAVGQAEGARLDRSDRDRVLASMLKLPPGNGSSMLYDRLAGRSLEHEYLTGEVVRLADRHHVEVPRNRTLLALLRVVAPLCGG